MSNLEKQKKLTDGKGWKNVKSVMEEKGYPESFIEEKLDEIKTFKKKKKQEHKTKKAKVSNAKYRNQ